MSIIDMAIAGKSLTSVPCASKTPTNASEIKYGDCFSTDKQGFFRCVCLGNEVIDTFNQEYRPLTSYNGTVYKLKLI